MFVVCVRVIDRELFDQVAVTGIRRVADASTVVVEAEADLSVGAAYNEVLEHFAADPQLDGVLILDEGAEVLDDIMLDRLRGDLTDGGVVLGAVGGVGPVDARWWSGTVVGRTEEVGGTLAGPTRDGAVDRLDGRLLVLSPEVVRTVRFDETSDDPLAVVAGFCDAVTAAGFGLRVVDLAVRHHVVLDTTQPFEAVPTPSPSPSPSPTVAPLSPVVASRAESTGLPSERPTPPGREGLMISWAQNHEDVVVARCFDRPGTYVDIGAGHPTECSVTRALYDRGWRGINVEPLSEWFVELRRERIDDANIQALVGTVPGVSRLHAMPHALGLSTTIDAQAELHGHVGVERDVRWIPCVTLTSVFDALTDTPVDLLKVDVEGAERDVLASLDWSRHRPRIVLVEATEPVLIDESSRYPVIPKRTDHLFSDILFDNGYSAELFDGLNVFYVAEEEAEIRARIAAPANILDGFLPSRFVT